LKENLTLIASTLDDIALRYYMCIEKIEILDFSPKKLENGTL
jgi:hypothetical protein